MIEEEYLYHFCVAVEFMCVTSTLFLGMVGIVFIRIEFLHKYGCKVS